MPDAWSELRPHRRDRAHGHHRWWATTPRANREMFVEILGEAGFRIVPVDSGERVLAAVEEGDVDLVLLDVRMPGMTASRCASS